jgi:hypothetical protein
MDPRITDGPELSLPANLPQYRRRQLAEGIRYLLSRCLAGVGQADDQAADQVSDLSGDTIDDGIKTRKE